MSTPATETPETTVAYAKTQIDKRPNASLDLVVDKRAETLRAKKKKKRTAHQVALRRSHTGG